MKTVFFVLALLLIAGLPGQLQAANTLRLSNFIKPADNDQTVKQEREVHNSIKAFIGKNYPSAKVKLFLPEENDYRVRFKMEGKEYTALFSATGQWIETSEKMSLAQVPGQVKQAVDASQYSSAKTYNVTEVTLSSNPGTNLFVVEVGVTKNEWENGGNIPPQVHKLYYTPTGKLVKDELEHNQSLPYQAWGDY